jgi:hypothetical protein
MLSANTKTIFADDSVLARGAAFLDANVMAVQL